LEEMKMPKFKVFNRTPHPPEEPTFFELVEDVDTILLRAVTQDGTLLINLLSITREGKLYLFRNSVTPNKTGLAFNAKGAIEITP
jgi:hypothetical protein